MLKVFYEEEQAIDSGNRYPECQPRCMEENFRIFNPRKEQEIEKKPDGEEDSEEQEEKTGDVSMSAKNERSCYNREGYREYVYSQIIAHLREVMDKSAV